MRTLFKNRVSIAIALFFITFVASYNVFGGGCADGWDSPSIGNRGACSHHGGVNRNPLPIILAFGVPYGFLCLIGMLFRTHGPYVVPSALPAHPREEELAAKLTHRPVVLIPKVAARAKKPWTCVQCKIIFGAGSTYSYVLLGRAKYSRRIKYCAPCVKKLSGINAINSDLNALEAASLERARAEVEAYYKAASE